MDKGLLKGQCAPVSLISWHSSKINRVWFQLAKMLGNPIQVRAVNQAVNLIDACLVTDSRNVNVNMSIEVLCPKGAECRVEIELLSLKH